MQITFENFDQFAEYLYKKRLAYEELKDENRQLEMDRLRMSDQIAELEEEIYELKNNRIVLKDDCVPNLLRHTDQKIKNRPLARTNRKHN